MDTGGYALVFAAGVIAALNPCGFALLPGYLGLAVGRSDGVRSVARGLTVALAMTAGFVTIFGAFGLLAISVSALLARVLPYVTVVVGAAMVWLGVRQWRGPGIGVPGIQPRYRGKFGGTLSSMFGYGVIYALVSLSCTIAPFLAVTGIGLGAGPRAGVVLAVYAAGFATVVGAVAMTGTALAQWLRRGASLVSRAGAVLLILAGGYIGYYGGYEIRLRDLSEPDPIIAAAARAQGAIAGWAYTAAQSTEVLVAVAALVVGAAVLSLRQWLRRKD